MKTNQIKRMAKLDKKFYAFVNAFNKGVYLIEVKDYIKNMMGKEYHELMELHQVAVSYLMCIIGHNDSRELIGYTLTKDFQFVAEIKVINADVRDIWDDCSVVVTQNIKGGLVCQNP